MHCLKALPQNESNTFAHAESGERVQNAPRRSLSRGIARTVMVATASLAVVCAVLFALVFYLVLDRQAASDLRVECESLAEILDAQTDADTEAKTVLERHANIVVPGTRVTLIDPDGDVLFDTAVDVADLGNHALRPEVIEAMEKGEGRAGRYSETLDEETLYHSVRLEEGSVLRLAKTHSSVWGIMSAMLAPYLLVLFATVGISLLVGWVISRKVTSELSAVDLDRPFSANAPEELVPLLKRLDEQRKRLDAQVAERRRFTGNVSHELKTPLTVISGYAEIIERGIARPEDVTQFAGHIYEEAQHMKSMVDELLTLSRLDDAEAEDMRIDMGQSVSLAEVARNVSGRLSSAARRRGITVRVSVFEGDGSGDVEVVGNARMIEEMLRNLMENAIRYNVDGGKVDVCVGRDAQGSPFVRVADTGMGVPEEMREKVFERFFCVDESRSKETGGSGLGLAIVKHAAQLHGASVSISDNKPCGSVFEVLFPQ